MMTDCTIQPFLTLQIPFLPTKM